jgi:hypothetical protein
MALSSLFVLCLCLPLSVQAGEPHKAISLSDNGQGSTVRAGVQINSSLYYAVGSKKMHDGGTTAIFWEIAVDPSDPSGNTVYATELPGPVGANTAATGIAFAGGDPDRPVICGIVSPRDSASGLPTGRATVWTRDASGQFTNTTLDDQAALASRANAVVFREGGSGGNFLVVGEIRTRDSNWHACKWEGPELDAGRNCLVILSAAPSTANAVVVRPESGRVVIGGGIRGKDGRWIATLMEEEGIYYFLKPLPTPSNTQSFLNGLYRDFLGRIVAAGDITGPNGRKRASVWINQAEIPAALLLLNNLAGYANSSANALAFIGNTLLVVGSAWNTERDRIGFAALRINQTFQNPFRFDALRSRTETVDNNETITIHGAMAGGGFVGECRNGSVPQATLFLPTAPGI